MKIKSLFKSEFELNEYTMNLIFNILSKDIVVDEFIKGIEYNNEKSKLHIIYQLINEYDIKIYEKDGKICFTFLGKPKFDEIVDIFERECSLFNDTSIKIRLIKIFKTKEKEYLDAN